MGIDLQGIARLVGAGGTGTPGVRAPGEGAGFVTTVKRASEIGPFDTVIQKAAAEKAQAAPSQGTVEGAEDFKVKNAAKARKQFEAFALQAFIGAMLPKENAHLFGTGSAGKLWQSMMAEKLADQIASSGRLKLLPDEPSVAAAADPAQVTGSRTKPNGEAR